MVLILLPLANNAFGAGGGTRRDFVLGCLLAASALNWRRVLVDCWVLPHHSARASFGVGWWSAQVCQSVRFLVVCLAAWVSAVDKSRGSKSTEVRRIWEFYDECLQVVQPRFWEGVRSALSFGDVSLAWSV